MNHDTQPSLSFRLEGEVSVFVAVTQTTDGTLRFTVEVDGSGGQTADINGLFFDLPDESLVDGLMADGAEITKTVFDYDNVDNLGGGVNIKGDLVNDTDLFDAGVRFGTSGMAKDDIQFTEFTLSQEGGPLTLADIAGMDFGVRLTSVGDIDGSRDGSLKLGGTAPELEPERPGPGENEGPGPGSTGGDGLSDEFDFDTGDDPVELPMDGPEGLGDIVPLEATVTADGALLLPPDEFGPLPDDGLIQSTDDFVFL